MNNSQECLTSIYTKFVVGVRNTYVLVARLPGYAIGHPIDDWDIGTYNVQHLSVSGGIVDPQAKAAEFSRAAAIRFAESRKWQLGDMRYIPELGWYKHALLVDGKTKSR
jgi:hypothetical protein